MPVSGQSGDGEKDEEAENYDPNPYADVGSNLIQGDLDAAKGGVHVGAVGDEDDLLDRGVVQIGGVAAAETVGAGLTVREAGAPVHQARLQPGPQQG